MELRELLIEYKNNTELLIGVIKTEDYELRCQELLSKRENLLTTLKDMVFDVKELVKISKEIDLMPLEEEVFNLLNEEKCKIKEEILSLKNNHNAVKTYSTDFKSIYFINKEI